MINDRTIAERAERAVTYCETTARDYRARFRNAADVSDRKRIAEHIADIERFRNSILFIADARNATERAERVERAVTVAETTARELRAERSALRDTAERSNAYFIVSEHYATAEALRHAYLHIAQGAEAN